MQKDLESASDVSSDSEYEDSEEQPCCCFGGDSEDEEGEDQPYQPSQAGFDTSFNKICGCGRSSCLFSVCWCYLWWNQAELCMSLAGGEGKEVWGYDTKFSWLTVVLGVLCLCGMSVGIFGILIDSYLWLDTCTKYCRCCVTPACQAFFLLKAVADGSATKFLCSVSWLLGLMWLLNISGWVFAWYYPMYTMFLLAISLWLLFMACHMIRQNGQDKLKQQAVKAKQNAMSLVNYQQEVIVEDKPQTSAEKVIKSFSSVSAGGMLFLIGLMTVAWNTWYLAKGLRNTNLTWSSLEPYVCVIGFICICVGLFGLFSVGSRSVDSMTNCCSGCLPEGCEQKVDSMALNSVCALAWIMGLMWTMWISSWSFFWFFPAESFWIVCILLCASPLLCGCAYYLVSRSKPRYSEVEG